MKHAILEVINLRAPIKEVDLALAVMEIMNPQKFDIVEFRSSLEDLIKYSQVVELEYVNSDTDYRIRSIFFKKGTMIIKKEHEAVSS